MSERPWADAATTIARQCGRDEPDASDFCAVAKAAFHDNERLRAEVQSLQWLLNDARTASQPSAVRVPAVWQCTCMWVNLPEAPACEECGKQRPADNQPATTSPASSSSKPPLRG